MADNELTVIDAAGATKTLRAVDHGSGLQAQGVVVWEGRDVPAATTGSVVRYTVTPSAAVALDPPDAGARYARLRCYEASGSTPNQNFRLFYREDGIDPGANGSQAAGFLLHGELMLVKIADFTNFKMIGETSSSFLVYVEWLAIP